MKIFFPAIALTGLILLFVPAMMHYAGSMSEDIMKEIMFLGTLIWFAGAIPWLGQKREERVK